MEWNNVIIQGENERERETAAIIIYIIPLKKGKTRIKKTQNIQFWVRAQSRG